MTRTASTPSACKAKGRRLQQAVAADLVRAFQLPEADCRSNPMGCGGEDVWLSDRARTAIGGVSFECKNQERVNVFAAFEQASSNAGIHKPALVLKRNHTAPLCVLRWDDALDLLVRAGATAQHARDGSDGSTEDLASREQVATTDAPEEHSPKEDRQRSPPGTRTGELNGQDAGVPPCPVGTATWLRHLADAIESS